MATQPFVDRDVSIISVKCQHSLTATQGQCSFGKLTYNEIGIIGHPGAAKSDASAAPAQRHPLARACVQGNFPQYHGRK
ncbi:hypothetical protein [Rhizocola hellebori]|uniref:hypothetical protein n=1 Tax=Rhizocola hellebori TaxID=1392758 RepID=UPI0019442658|nr:hypothetical protein [Rhizocola hellebori]